jgi:hypothetical protein
MADSAAVVDDRTKIWSTVGSAGTVDVADLNGVVFSGSIVQLGLPEPTQIGPSTADAEERIVVDGTQEQAVIRYNVTPVDGLFPTAQSNPVGPVYNLTLRYRVGEGRIVAKLIQVGILTGEETTLINWDTASAIFLPEGNSWHTSDLGANSYVGSLDFASNAYYIELTLSAVVGLIPLKYPPAVSVIQLRDETSYMLSLKETAKSEERQRAEE